MSKILWGQKTQKKKNKKTILNKFILLSEIWRFVDPGIKNRGSNHFN